MTPRNDLDPGLGSRRPAPECDLPLQPGSFDLLISLFAGPVWDHCKSYLAPCGLLLANTSHGDASIAALDPDLELVAAVHHRGGRYRLDLADLDSYLIPKSATPPDADSIRHSGRGIAYTRTAFAYVFRANVSGADGT